MQFRYAFIRVDEIDPISGKPTGTMRVEVAPDSIEPVDQEARSLSPQRLAEMRIKIAEQAEAEVRARKL